MSAYLSLENINMSFTAKGKTFCALDNVNLRIDRGELISIIGHSGCGKSTVLNIIAGLLQTSTGGVLLEFPERFAGREPDPAFGDLLPGERPEHGDQQLEHDHGCGW